MTYFDLWLDGIDVDYVVGAAVGFVVGGDEGEVDVKAVGVALLEDDFPEVAKGELEVLVVDEHFAVFVDELVFVEP